MASFVSFVLPIVLYMNNMLIVSLLALTLFIYLFFNHSVAKKLRLNAKWLPVYIITVYAASIFYHFLSINITVMNDYRFFFGIGIGITGIPVYKLIKRVFPDE